jgi:hypothetical protein
VLSAPPRDAPEVAWDFWQQFDQFERLEELRQFRPALYRALPIDPRLAARDSRPVRDQSDESEQTETRAMPVAPRLVSRDSPSARAHSDESQSPSEPPAVSREPRS